MNLKVEQMTVITFNDDSGSAKTHYQGERKWVYIHITHKNGKWKRKRDKWAHEKRAGQLSAQRTITSDKMCTGIPQCHSKVLYNVI